MTPRDSSSTAATAAFLRFAKSGAPEELATVFDATALRLTVLAGHLCRDAAEAEDLVQSTFLVAMRDAESFDGSRPIESWLAGILRHRALDLGRRRRSRAERERSDDLPDAIEPARGPLELAADAELFEQVTAAIERIDGPSRQVLALRLVHGLEPTAIAHALGRSPGTVRMQLKRGLERLREAVPAGAAALVGGLVLEGRGLAAVRESLLTSVGASAQASAAAATTAQGVFTTTTPLFGAIIVKHWISLAIAALVVVVVGFVVWDPQEASSSLGRESGGAPPVELASDGADVPLAPDLAQATPLRIERTAVTSTPALAAVAAEGRALDVRVVWEDSRRPAADVGLYLRRASGEIGSERRTDTAGSAFFDDLVPGPYLVATELGGATIRVDTRERRELEIALPEGTTAGGIVVDLKGEPVAGAEILRIDPTHHRVMHVLGTTASDGVFEIDHVDPEALLIARHDDWQPAQVEDCGDDLEFVLGAKGHRLFGRVLDPSGAPVPFARLAIGVDEDAREIFEGSELAPGELEGSKKSMDLEGILIAADENGRFDTREVPAGYVLIVARPLEADSGLVAWASGYIHFSSELELDLQLTQGATVHGRIADRTDAPIANAEIRAEWEGTRALGQFEAELGRYVADPVAHSDDEGRFELTGLLPGDYDFTAHMADFFLAREDRELDDGEHFEWNPVVANGGSLAVRLVDENGAPVEGWHVVALEPDAEIRPWYRSTARTDADGRATIHGLADGVALDLALHAPTLSGRASGLAQCRRTGVVPSDQVLEVVLTAAERATASVTGTWPSEPVDPSLILLKLERTDWNASAFVAVAADGSFTFAPLGAGEYRLVTAGGGFPADVELARIELGVGEALDLGLVRPPLFGQLEIELVDADGAAVEQASIRVLHAGENAHAVVGTSAGRFVTSPLEPGTYTLCIDTAGSPPKRVDVEVTSELYRTLRIELERGVCVPLRVLPYTGRSGAPTKVWLRVTDGTTGVEVISRYLTRAADEPEFALDLHLVPGIYELSLRDQSPARRGTFYAELEVVAGADVAPIAATLD
ncbi:RNA polymerase sigma factor SigX [Planctomycetes bacterium Pla163]|uniref:RNA polymerase sigma factor n=1 Tax=Rohdeia mirabilis TaxID=2528008 RepID=A0A518D3A7_9BACT|nr:RNA polymerase sigma factor SigX [Planctomycetes bacterium Pla163]